MVVRLDLAPGQLAPCLLIHHERCARLQHLQRLLVSLKQGKHVVVLPVQREELASVLPYVRTIKMSHSSNHISMSNFNDELVMRGSFPHGNWCGGNPQISFVGLRL